jgi:adenylosuccinate synthase
MQNEFIRDFLFFHFVFLSAKNYIAMIGKLLEIPVHWIGVGSNLDDMIDYK